MTHIPVWAFTGDDWTELGQVFWMVCDNDDPQTAGLVRERVLGLAERIVQAENQQLGLTEVEHRQIAAVRAWANKIAHVAEGRHWEYPLWVGLVAIKEDMTFLKMVAVLLEYMVT